MQSRAARWIAPAAIVTLALVVRLAAWHATLPTPSLDDEARYEYYGRALATGGPTLGMLDWPPGVIWYHAAVQWLLGPRTASARLGSVLAGTLAVLATLALARRLAGRRAALVAGLVAALHPELVFFSVSLYSEPLYLPLALGGLLAVSTPAGLASPIRLILGGLLFGLAALTRDVGLLAAAGVAGWGFLESRGAPPSIRRRPLILAAAVVVTLLPWSLRVNAGSPLLFLTSRTSPVTLYVGNADFETPATHGGFLSRGQAMWAGFRAYRALGETDAERQERARRATREAILRRMPAWPWIKVKAALPRLLVPGSLPVARLMAHPDDPGTAGEWAYRGAALSSRDVRKTVARSSVAVWLLIGGLGLPGLAFAARHPFGRLLLAFTAAHVLGTVLAFAVSRHRLPFEPVLIATMASVLVSGRTLWAESSWPVRLSAVVLLAGFVLLTVAGWETVRLPRWT